MGLYPSESIWTTDCIRSAKTAVSMRPESLANYTDAFAATHRRLFEVLHVHAEQAPPYTRSKIYRGATVGYGHIQKLFEQANLQLPEERDFNYQKEADREVADRLDEIEKAMISGRQAPNPFLELFTRRSKNAAARILRNWDGIRC